MDSNKINNKIEIKECLSKVSKTNIKMNLLDTGLPVYYEPPYYCNISKRTRQQILSKPCILCKNYCDSCILTEDISKPKLTRQTNQHFWIDCIFDEINFDKNLFDESNINRIFGIPIKKHFTEKDNK